MKNLTKEQWAYLAGIIDGEGHIAINKCKPIGSWRNTNYHVELTIVNTSIELIDFLIVNFDGSFVKRKKEKDNHKFVYSWRVSRKKAEFILKNCFPYFIIKTQEVNIAFLLFDRIGKQNTKELSEKELQSRERLFRLIKKVRHAQPVVVA